VSVHVRERKGEKKMEMFSFFSIVVTDLSGFST